MGCRVLLPTEYAVMIALFPRSTTVIILGLGCQKDHRGSKNASVETLLLLCCAPCSANTEACREGWTRATRSSDANPPPARTVTSSKETQQPTQSFEEKSSWWQDSTANSSTNVTRTILTKTSARSALCLEVPERRVDTTTGFRTCFFFFP